MSATGNVEITITDGAAGAVIVPASTVQLVIGCCSGGVANQIVATRSPQSLQTNLQYGPLPEAAALSCNAGGTVLAMKATTNTAGLVTGSNVATLAITGSTGNAVTPIVLTVGSTTSLLTGMVVTIAGMTGNTNANGTWVITVLSGTTFSINATGNGAFGGSPTAQYTGLTFTGTGTSVPTITGTPNDDTNVLLTVVVGATIGVTGGVFTISLDAGRTTGPNIALGTASTYVLPQTGMTINFAAGTLVKGDKIAFSTTAPTWTTAGILACLQAFQSSQYATAGIGSIHIVGVCSGANASTIEGYLDTLATGYLFERAMLESRDAKTPIAWGGVGETETAWLTAIQADFAAVSAKRLLAGAGYYNMPSAFPNPAAGAPRYRRPLTWAQAARQVAIPAQRHSGRVRDGSLSQIVIDPTNDPNDGFIYHDERLNPGLDILVPGGAGRFCSALTRVGEQGYFIQNPLLLSPIGSDFTIWPLGAVMDVACTITHQKASKIINSDVRVNQNGTLYENDARDIENTILLAINDNMTAVAMISSAKVSVDRTVNVQSTSKVKVTVTIYARGYVLEVDLFIGYGSAAAAA